MYGVQVMRGVMEEKSNRIVEIIISSVKPFQLMMGKVLGVALTALTQFFIWVVLSIVLISIVRALFIPDLQATHPTSQPHNLMEVTKSATQVQPSVVQANPELEKVVSILDSY